MRKKRRRLRRRVFAAVLLLIGFVCWGWFRAALSAMPSGQRFYYRFHEAVSLEAAIERLHSLGVVRNPGAMRLYAWLHRAPSTVQVGTYRAAPGESADEILKGLAHPVRQSVRLPETNWARRNANLLEKDDVTTAREYLALVNNPAEFEGEVGFPLPSKSLEGYLYPDTYNLPPLLGARAVVQRQLKAFETKVWERMGHPSDLNRIVTIASLIELEAGRDEDRPQIAGVIQNRIKKGMPLQLDASLMYALGKWRRLRFKDYRTIKSPYNLYLHKGLPPTPICSPSVKSIEAAMNPAHNDYLFYVALPSGESLFSKTFEEHKRKIKRRMKAMSDVEDLRWRQADAAGASAEGLP
ncbi:MAG TPA: endolytic transglycosylase MltG [Fimbriimonas sp.]|nr:endolytic transglycosylase MltG [Fimbriimonas sp.]